MTVLSLHLMVEKDLPTFLPSSAFGSLYMMYGLARFFLVAVPSVEVVELVGGFGGGSASGASAGASSAPTPRVGTCDSLRVGAIAPLRLQFLASIMIERWLYIKDVSGQSVLLVFLFYFLLSFFCQPKTAGIG